MNPRRHAAALFLAALPLGAMAQDRPARPDIAKVIGIDADRAAQVKTILRAAHEKRRAAMQSIQADTDAQLATVLSADELARLKAAFPHPPGPGRGAPGTPSVTQ
ncbi:MAG TPA: hypothetical protein VFE23_07075 [Usitatibacter sp.]|nr:hypothetical protein [Usitatibacter sp.]